MAKAAGSRQRDLVFYLRDAGITALMTLPIAFPMFGFYLIMGGEGRASGGYGTGVEPRLMWVVVAVLLVFVGRFIISFLRNDPALTGVTQKSAIETRRYMSETIGPWIGPGLLSLALLWPLLPFVDRWLLDLGILVLTYIMLGWGLNIVVGLAGCLTWGTSPSTRLAHTLCVDCVELRLVFLMSSLGRRIRCFVRDIVGFSSAASARDYLAIVTLGFEIIRIILLNWYEFTKGRMA